MKTQILNLGKALNKTEQKQINGGRIEACIPRCKWSKRCCDYAEQ